MVPKRKYLAKVQRLNLSALFLFFCLFTLSASASSFNTNVDNILNDTDKYILSENNHSTPHADNRYSDFLYNPFQSPAEPIPTPSEPNEKDNKENQDDDDWSSLRFRFYGDFDFVFKSYNISLAQFGQNVLKRNKISLVVLHHSWKSFLS
jgi:hypothetical protein